MQSSTIDSSVVHVVDYCPLPPLTVVRGRPAGLRRWCCNATSKRKTRVTSPPLGAATNVLVSKETARDLGVNCYPLQAKLSENILTTLKDPAQKTEAKFAALKKLADLSVDSTFAQEFIAKNGMQFVMSTIENAT